MASLGAKVMQVRSVELAMVHKVRIFVRSELRQARGHRSARARRPARSSATRRRSWNSRSSPASPSPRTRRRSRIRRVQDKPGVAAAIFGPLAEANINVDMIVQNVSADGATTDMTFTVPAADYERAADTHRPRRAAKIGYDRLDGATDVAKVSVIGIGMRSHAGVAAQAFKALADKRHQHPRHHHLGDQVLAADRRRLYRAGGAHAAFALRARQRPDSDLSPAAALAPAMFAIIATA